MPWWNTIYSKRHIYSISQEICTRFLLCSTLLWLYIDFPISIRLTSLALWQSNDCPSASKATLMNMDKYFMWIHYERLHNYNIAKHNKTVCIFLGIYCTFILCFVLSWLYYQLRVSFIHIRYFVLQVPLQLYDFPSAGKITLTCPW